MNNNELLLSISELLDKKLDEKLDTKLDEKLQPIITQIHEVDERLSAQIKDVDDRLSDVDDRLSAQIINLDFAIHKTNILIENDVLPPLKEIQSCYLDTYERYIKESDHIEKLCTDMDAVKSVIRNHFSVNIA